MPRPTKNRDPFGERNVAARVALERERRSMTYEGLAKRMSDAGCKIHSSALYKIEKGDPPRRITVTELLAFSKVLELPLAELVADPRTYMPHRVFELVDTAARLEDKAGRMMHEYLKASEAAATAAREARGLLQDNPSLSPLVDDLIAARRGEVTPRGEHLDRIWGDVSGEFHPEELLTFASNYSNIRRPGLPHASAMSVASKRLAVSADTAAKMFEVCERRGLFEEEEWNR